jgi:hypothetical protein
MANFFKISKIPFDGFASPFFFVAKIRPKTEKKNTGNHPQEERAKFGYR